MNAREMFEEQRYKRNEENEKITYLQKFGSGYFKITFDLSKKEIAIDTNMENVIEDDLLQAINKQCKELGWLEEETCTNGSNYDSTEEFICSYCGMTLVEYKNYIVGEDAEEECCFDFKPKYCPNCGRKIID